MTSDFSIARFFRRVLRDQQRPCLLLLDKEFRLQRLIGEANYYGFTDLQPDKDCRDAMPFLYGLVPNEAIQLPLMETPSGRSANVLLAPVLDKLGLLLTDASRERAARQVLQQQANGIRLLHQEQQELLEELRRAQDELEAKHRQAEDVSRLKSRFIASLSHELRAPLAGILGHAGFLVDPRRDVDSIIESAGLIRSSATHLLSLVDNVLDQASLEMGQLVLHPTPVRADSLCREVQALFAPLATERGLELRIEHRGHSPQFIEMDVTRLRQVVINLVTNGIKYTDRGFVALTLNWKRDLLEVAVADSGPGIAQAARERIFLPFHREQNSQGNKGAGLGLSISARLVELMGGCLRYEERPGGGSVFRFSVPAAETSAIQEQEQDEGSTGQSVLLVDDSPDIRILYRRLLQKHGFSVEAVASEPEAWVRYQHKRPDLVIVDLYLGSWEGSGFVQRLRERGFKGGVLAWSASSLREDRQRALEAGADAFLLKPVDIAVMRATVSEILYRGDAART